MRGEVELFRQSLDDVLLVIHGNTKHHFVWCYVDLAQLLRGKRQHNQPRR